MLTVVALCAVAIGVGVLIGYFDASRVVRRRLRKTPVTAIDAVREGVPARIVGVAQPLDGKTGIASLTGRTCLLCIAEVELDHQTSTVRGGSSTSWPTAAIDRHGVRFVVDDGTGRALIDPTHVKLALEDEQHGESLQRGQTTERVAALLADQRVAYASHHVRWRETVLLPGARVSVYGSGVRSIDPAQRGDDYRTAETWLEMSGSVGAPLLVSDAPSTTSRQD